MKEVLCPYFLTETKVKITFIDKIKIGYITALAQTYFFLDAKCFNYVDVVSVDVAGTPAMPGMFVEVEESMWYFYNVGSTLAARSLNRPALFIEKPSKSNIEDFFTEPYIILTLSNYSFKKA